MKQQMKFKKNLILKRILFLLMLILTFYIIFNFSSQNGIESGNLSRKVTEKIVELISKIKNMDIDLKIHYIEKLHPFIRKLAHYSIYTLVGFSIMGFMCTFNIRNVSKFVTSICIGITYAITDEIHQSFTPYRGPSVIDVCIDSAGVITGIFVLIIFIILTESITNWMKR